MRTHRPLRATTRVAPLLVVAALVVACSGGTSSSGAPKPTGALAHDAEVLRGRDIFTAQCANCHGPAGGGGLGPSFHGGKLQRDFPDIAAQIQVVEHGRDNMPPFRNKLSAAEIHAVVRYEREVLSPEK